VGIFRKSDNEKRLVAARGDLDAAIAKLAAIDAGKAAALSDNAAFRKWQSDRSEAAIEVDRLTALVASLQGDAEAARISDEREATRRRLAAARKDAGDLAQRIQIDGQRIAAELLQLARDAAQQALEAKALNADLPEGETPIAAADILARDAGAAPRKDLRSREVALWVVAGTGAIVGNQGAVVSKDGVTGQLDDPFSSMRPRCVKRRFREIEYQPHMLSDWPGDFHTLVRLPRLDGPGFLFDGALLTTEAVAAINVDATVKPAKRQPRPVQIELIPVDPVWPPAGIAPGEADRSIVA
jgi:hypothetical protein